MEIVLASHATLAKGMYETVSLIIGEQPILHYISAYLDDNVKFIDQLSSMVQDIATNEIVFITDIVGGSVNNELINFVANKPNCMLISGMNLPFVLELVNFVSSNSNISINEIKDKVSSFVNAGRDGLNVVELPINTEEEDF